MIGVIRGLFLGFALSGDGLHGFTDRVFISQELHGLHGLQVLVQLIKDGDSCGQIQLHNRLLGHTWSKHTGYNERIHIDAR